MLIPLSLYMSTLPLNRAIDAFMIIPTPLEWLLIAVAQKLSHLVSVVSSVSRTVCL